MASTVPGSATRPEATDSPAATPATARTDHARRLWYGYFALAAVGVAVYLLAPHVLVRDAAFLALGALSVAGIVVGVRVHRPVPALPWHIMALSQLLWLIADTLYTWYEDVLGVDPFPSPADVFYLAAYPLVALALLLFIRARVRDRDIGGLLDSVIVTIGLGLLLWVLLAHPALEQAQGDTASAVVAIAYPLGDVLLVGGVIRLLTASGARSASLWLLLGAIGAQVVADTAYDALDLFDIGESHGLDLLWMASYVLWGAAAMHPSMAALSRPAPDTNPRFGMVRLVFMTAATLVAPVTLAVQDLLGVRLDVWGVVVGSVVLFLLVVTRMKLVVDQITEVSAQQERLRRELAYQASHDSLTSLPNRAQAMRLIGAALSRARRRGALVALLFVDLDGFKAVNDRHGHLAGDDVLRAVARRMTAGVREGDLVARLGGDEFLALLEDVDSEASAVSVAERLVDAVAEPIPLVVGDEVTVGASVGVTFNGDGGIDPEAFLHEADLAVYRAKAGGRGRVEVLSDTLRAELARRAEFEEAIRSAVERDELDVHYQPIFGVRSGQVTGYEALVRWDRPGHGPVPPIEIIEAAEASELICDLDTWVLRQVAARLEQWNREGPRTSVVSVNLSGRHLNRDRVVADVAGVLRDHDVDPGQIVVEVTETVRVDDLYGVAHLHRLRELGVRVGLDDAGTGHNLAAAMSRLPLDLVKIDQRFLSGAAAERAMLWLLVQTAHEAGLAVVAEGVERADQLAILDAIQVEAAQGYHLSRPLPPAELERFRATHPIAEDGPLRPAPPRQVEHRDGD